MFEQLNHQIFMLINAPNQASQLDVYFAIFIANDTLYLLCIGLLLTWFLGTYQAKSLALKAVLCCSFALIVGYIVSLLFPHERPFVLHMGNTLIAHTATASFPSNHMTIFSTIALSYIFSKQFKWGFFLLMGAFMVAWARIYVGVHFPLDMVGGLILALITNVLFLFIWPHLNVQIMNLLLKIYQRIFSVWINKGIIR